MELKIEFTKDARVVLILAAQLASEEGFREVLPEHVLLGLLKTYDCGAVRAMRALGLPVEKMRQQVEEVLRRLQPVGAPLANPPYSDGTQAVLREAAKEAAFRRLGYVDTTLMLLGMLRHSNSEVSHILVQNGVRESLFPARLPSSLPMRERPIFAPRPSSHSIDFLKAFAIPSLSISPVFLGLLGFTLLAGALSFTRVLKGGVPVFLFVVGGWIVSLCLHEFGHALTAYNSGDTSVAAQGYLSLNPLRYTQWLLSILFPLLILISGGIGLPGGAVYINMAAITERRMRSLVSAAGPIMTALCALVLAVPFLTGFAISDWQNRPEFWSAVAFLAFLQVTALLLNLLPLPGLDGYGIIAPYLPPRWQEIGAIASRFAFFIFLLLFFYNTPVSRGFFALVMGLIRVLRLDPQIVFYGFSLFRFWGG
jgi:Zn-dependent protease